MSDSDSTKKSGDFQFCDGAFTVSNWRTFERNTLRGFFDVTLPSGMILRGCSLHEKNRGRWVGLPSTKFKKADGSFAFTPTVEFSSREAADGFRDLVLAALDAAGVAR